MIKQFLSFFGVVTLTGLLCFSSHTVKEQYGPFPEPRYVRCLRLYPNDVYVKSFLEWWPETHKGTYDMPALINEAKRIGLIGVAMDEECFMLYERHEVQRKERYRGIDFTYEIDPSI